MELVMTLPILGIVLFALFEFSLLFFARGQVVEACRAGGRMAALPGCGCEAVEARVRQSLSPSLRQSAQIEVEAGEHSGDWVRVAVSVPMQDASPNLLWPVGFNLKNRTLYAETWMVKE
jgi:hypothetical protein